MWKGSRLGCVNPARNEVAHLAKEEGARGGAAATEDGLELLLAHVRRLAVDRLEERENRKVERI